MISPTVGDFSASSGSFRRRLAELLKLLKKHFSSTSIIEYSKLTYLVFDFSDPEIRIFNQKKKLVGYLVLSLNLYLLVMTVFHTYNNNILYRFYMGSFMVTPTYDQVIFDASMSFAHLSMVRMNIYLLFSDYRQDFRQFQWVKFLRIEDEQTLIREHYFTAKEARSYLFLIGLFMRFCRVNTSLFVFGTLGMMARSLYLAYNVIPFHWFILSALPNAAGFIFATQNSGLIYNFFMMIFFANVMFIRKSLRSLVAQRAALFLHSPGGRYKLKKSKLRRLVKQNLVQFNYIISNFQQCQRNCNYFLSFSLGLVSICYSYPYTLLFVDLDTFSFFSTLSLYVQGMAITIWLPIKINGLLVKTVQDYSNDLYLLIYECPSISLKLKLDNFFAIHQPDNQIGYKYILNMWDLSNQWFLTFILESVSIVILISSFNYLRTVPLN